MEPEDAAAADAADAEMLSAAAPLAPSRAADEKADAQTRNLPWCAGPRLPPPRARAPAAVTILRPLPPQGRKVPPVGPRRARLAGRHHLDRFAAH